MTKQNGLTVYPFADDTYMYDEALRSGVGGAGGGGIPVGAHYAVSALHHQGHWYDEPPYESDPDDFLMAGLNCGPAATIQVSHRIKMFMKNRQLIGVCLRSLLLSLVKNNTGAH